MFEDEMLRRLYIIKEDKLTENVENYVMANLHFLINEISVSHGGEYQNDVLECDIVGRG
jgi:hypothetical protein